MIRRPIGPINRIFQTNEFRLYLPDREVDISENYVPFFIKRHPNREMGRRVSFTKDKTALLRAAAAEARLELTNFDDDESGNLSELNHKSCASDINIFHILPRETILQILKNLNVTELSQFVKSSRHSRCLGYDKFLWKTICQKTWCKPSFMVVDLVRYSGTLRVWYNWNAQRHLTTLQVMHLFQKNIWRVAYIALHTLEAVPSIVDSPRTFFNRRTSECYATYRKVPYNSSIGKFRLVGIDQVSRVEFTVFNYTMQPWHRNEYVDIRPLAIFDLKNYGLKVTRSIRGQNLAGFVRRRGYYLKTDVNRKVHLAYRYFPTIRFRLYTQRDRVFLLCQDIFLNAGESVDCYTMYEIIKETEQDDVRSTDTEQEESRLSSQNSGSSSNDVTSQS